MFLVGMGLGGMVSTVVLSCRLSAHYADHVDWGGNGSGQDDVDVSVDCLHTHRGSHGLVRG